MSIVVRDLVHTIKMILSDDEKPTAIMVTTMDFTVTKPLGKRYSCKHKENKITLMLAEVDEEVLDTEYLKEVFDKCSRKNLVSLFSDSTQFIDYDIKVAWEQNDEITEVEVKGISIDFMDGKKYLVLDVMKLPMGDMMKDDDEDDYDDNSNDGDDINDSEYTDGFSVGDEFIIRIEAVYKEESGNDLYQIGTDEEGNRICLTKESLEEIIAPVAILPDAVIEFEL